jgi:hypothetical protein
MGEMARLISKQGVAPVIVDFVCPTGLTRAAFGKPDILIFMDTIAEGRFEDTNKMFERPTELVSTFEVTMFSATISVLLSIISLLFSRKNLLSSLVYMGEGN